MVYKVGCITLPGPLLKGDVRLAEGTPVTWRRWNCFTLLSANR